MFIFKWPINFIAVSIFPCVAQWELLEKWLFVMIMINNGRSWFKLMNSGQSSSETLDRYRKLSPNGAQVPWIPCMLCCADVQALPSVNVVARKVHRWQIFGGPSSSSRGGPRNDLTTGAPWFRGDESIAEFVMRLHRIRSAYDNWASPIRNGSTVISLSTSISYQWVRNLWRNRSTKYLPMQLRGPMLHRETGSERGNLARNKRCNFLLAQGCAMHTDSNIWLQSFYVGTCASGKYHMWYMCMYMCGCIAKKTSKLETFAWAAQRSSHLLNNIGNTLIVTVAVILLVTSDSHLDIPSLPGPIELTMWFTGG